MSHVAAVAQSPSCVQLFVTPWTAARQASLSLTIFRSSCLQPFPASGSFSMSQFFASGGQSIGVSTSASVLPMNIQDKFPLELTDLISLQSQELSRVFSNTTVQKHQFFSAVFFTSNCLILVIPFSSHLQSFLVSGSFPMSPFFASGGQSIGVPASASVLPMKRLDTAY